MTTAEYAIPAGARPRLPSILGIESGEGRTVTLMVTLYFVLSIAFVIVQTTAFSLFVDEFGSHGLPYAYLTTAALTPLIGFLYLQLSERVSFARSLFINLAFLVAVCLAFWLGLASSLRHWFVFLLPFWFQTMVGLANIVVWHVAGHLYNVRQAKRLYGLINAGNWLANIIGGLVVAGLLSAVGSATSYAIAAAAIALGAFVLVPVLRGLQGTSTPAPQPRAGDPRASARSPFRHPYSRLIFVYTLLWWISFTFIDNIFFDRASLLLPSSDALATFLARQLSVMGVIAIITSTFLTSLVARRYGLRVGLLVMPIVTTFAVALLAVGGSLDWSASTLFWIAAAAKTLNVALGFSLSIAMGTLLFQPLLGNLRAASQTIAESVIQPVALGLAGLILLVFNTTLHFNAVGLSYLFLPVAAAWFWVIFRISREYPLVMSEALKRRGLGESTSFVLDRSAEAQLRSSLTSPRPGLVLYAMDQLEQVSPLSWPHTLVEALPGLLGHPAVEVRQQVMRRLLALRLPAATPAVAARLAAESDATVRSLLIQFLAAMGDAGSHDEVLAALQSSDRMVRRGAILGLQGSQSAEDAHRAEGAVAALAASADAEDRTSTAEIIGELSAPVAAQLLPQLLKDSAASVRRAALRAAGGQPDARYLPLILDACEDPETSRTAEQVLVSRQASAIDLITREFETRTDADFPPARLLSMIRVLGRLPGSRSTELLASKISLGDSRLRLQVLRALSRLRYRAPSRSPVLEQVQRELALAASLAGACAVLEHADGRAALAVLDRALQHAFLEARSRVLLLLSFIYDGRAVMRALESLNRAAGTHSPLAQETVDALLPPRLKPQILPLVENISQGQRVEMWRAAGIGSNIPALSDLLQSLIQGGAAQSDAWTRLCAMYCAATLGQQSCLPALRVLGDSSHPAVREMARWAVRRLSTGSAQGEDNVLSLVERVLILKSAPIFGGTPDYVLADIAGQVEQLSFEKDQTIFNKGDRGDSLYVIVSGAVRVLDGDRVLNELKEGDVFGELALLDPEPRLATVKATEDTSLLRLDEARFQEVLAWRPEVSAAIIRVITRYLRSQLQYAREISTALRASESFGALKEPAADSR